MLPIQICWRETEKSIGTGSILSMILTIHKGLGMYPLWIKYNCSRALKHRKQFYVLFMHTSMCNKFTKVTTGRTRINDSGASKEGKRLD